MVEPGTGNPPRRCRGLFAAFNRHKRSAVQRLQSKQGQANFLQFIDSADAVVEGYRPGVMARRGISGGTMCARKPSLVFASISSVGPNDFSAKIVGHDLSIQAAAGLIAVAPGQETRLTLQVHPLADISSALFAALGIVTALFARAHHGPRRQCGR